MARETVQQVVARLRDSAERTMTRAIEDGRQPDLFEVGWICAMRTAAVLVQRGLDAPRGVEVPNASPSERWNPSRPGGEGEGNRRLQLGPRCARCFEGRLMMQQYRHELSDVRTEWRCDDCELVYEGSLAPLS